MLLQGSLPSLAFVVVNLFVSIKKIFVSDQEKRKEEKEREVLSAVTLNYISITYFVDHHCVLKPGDESKQGKTFSENELTT